MFMLWKLVQTGTSFKASCFNADIDSNFLLNFSVLSSQNLSNNFESVLFARD